jgi:hypothetical protein
MTIPKRLAIVLAVVLAAPIALFAADQATFVLRNGQRETGTLAAHGTQGHNLIDGQFALDNMPGGTGNLSEKAYAQDQVVAIDFSGASGTPSPTEVSALDRAPANSSVLVLRNGQVVYGTFDNISRGDTVSFTQNGQQQQYPVSQVARIYLDVPGARSAYNLPAGAVGNNTAANALGTSGQGAGSVVNVVANQPWTDTGITVQRGERVTFHATGVIEYSHNTAPAGPDGDASFTGRHNRYPVANMPVGGLIGRVGNGTPFPVGSNTQPVVMPAAGRLYLGINDDNLADNRGDFAVTITPSASSSQPIR